MTSGWLGGGSGANPLIVEKLVEENCKCNQYDIWKGYKNALGQLLKQFSKLYQAWGTVTRLLLEGWCTQNTRFSRFLENISASFLYFLIKSFLVEISYRVLVRNIKYLIIGILVTLETRLKVPILAVF